MFLPQVKTWFSNRRGKAQRNARRRKSGVALSVTRELRNAYKQMPAPSDEQCTLIATRIGWTIEQTRRWFQARHTGQEDNIGVAEGTRLSLAEAHSYLERLYEQVQYPERSAMEQAASTLGTTLRKVRTWFNNRRARGRREAGRGPSSVDGASSVVSGQSAAGDVDMLSASRPVPVGRVLAAPVFQTSKVRCTCIRDRASRHAMTLFVRAGVDVAALGYCAPA